HRDDGQPRSLPHVEPVEVGLNERAHDLSHAVRAIVEADERITIAHRRDRVAVVHNHGWRDELVSLVALIGGANDLEWIRCLGSDAEHRHLVPFFRSIPSLVSVHAEVPTTKARHYGASLRVVE